VQKKRIASLAMRFSLCTYFFLNLSKKPSLGGFLGGVKEVLLTFGSMGSIIYDGSTFHKIPAYIPKEVVNATGAGDTYMTGYLYKRAKGASIEEAGRFAAAMTTLKIEGIGPFNGTKEDVLRCLETAEQRMPE
jgi:sugar/nucleoside kinase (ribokinase family)